MLINLTPNHQEIERCKKIAKELNFTYIPTKDLMVEQGIYMCQGFNFPHSEFMEFEDVSNIPFEQAYRLFAPTYHKSQYGVADNIEQIKEYFKEEVVDPKRRYFITVTFVNQEKENKGKGDGWRWHKWGEYIGTLDCQCEYLDDEDFGDDFEGVFCFHIYEIFGIILKSQLKLA